MFEKFFGLNYQRNRLLRSLPDGVLKNYYQQPFPDPSRLWKQVEYICIDLELTGLNPKKDEILSIGYAPILDGRIILEQSVHTLVRPSADLPESSVIIHGLTDDYLAKAKSLEMVLPKVLEVLKGRVLLAHHAPIELGFLNAACKRLYGSPFLARVVDTLALEKSLLERRGQSLSGGVLRLANTRERYNLPRYKAHNALVDAIASGELFLAQMAHRSYKNNTVKLSSILR